MRTPTLTGTTPDTVQPVRFLSALYNRNFRLLWLSFTCASFVQRMDGVILGWLVLELTDSAFLVGLIGALRFLGALLGPITGVIADRYDRRRLQLVSLIAMSCIVCILLGLVSIRRLEVWYLFVATTVGGMLWAIYQPAQQSMQADIHSGRDLVNGIALTNIAMNLTSILGPALGGVLLDCCGPASQAWEWSEEDMVLALNWEDFQAGRHYAATGDGVVAASTDQGMTWAPTPITLPNATVRALAAAGAAPGVQWSYVVLLGLYLVQMASYLAMRLTQRPSSAEQSSVWRNLLAGMRYSSRDAGLWTSLVLAGMVNMVSFPLQFGLLPIFARDVFHVGAAGLGLLGAALGLGSLLGSIVMTVFGTLHRAGRLMVIGTTLWQVLLIIFGFTPDYYVALIVLVVMGVTQTISMANMTILLLGTASSDMRGRVMGLRSLAVAPLFPGGLLAGVAVTSVGAPWTTVGCGVIGLLIALAVAPWVPRRPGNQE